MFGEDLPTFAYENFTIFDIEKFTICVIENFTIIDLLIIIRPRFYNCIKMPPVRDGFSLQWRRLQKIIYNYLQMTNPSNVQTYPKRKYLQ